MLIVLCTIPHRQTGRSARTGTLVADVPIGQRAVGGWSLQRISTEISTVSEAYTPRRTRVGFLLNRAYAFFVRNERYCLPTYISRA